MQHEDYILAANYLGKDRDKKLSDNNFWVHLIKVLLDFITQPTASPSLAVLSLKLIQQNIAGDMTPEECSVLFKFFMHQEARLNEFDRASLFKSMIDISGFSIKDRRQCLTDMVLPRLPTMQLRDLNQVFLSYFQKPQLFQPQDSVAIISRLEACLEALAGTAASEASSDMTLLKTCQILVFNLAVHGVGNRSLWNNLMQVYEDRIMRDYRFSGGSYHIFSLIGFIIRH